MPDEALKPGYRSKSVEIRQAAFHSDYSSQQLLQYEQTL